MAQQVIRKPRYHVFLNNELIASTALLEDGVHVVQRYVQHPEYKNVRLYIRDTHRWDLPVVYDVVCGQPADSNVVPLRPDR